MSESDVSGHDPTFVLDPRDPAHKAFKDDVHTYVQLIDAKRDLQQRLRAELREADAQMAGLSDRITAFMRQNGLPGVELGDGSGKLNRRRAKKTEALKKEHILAELMQVFEGDGSRAAATLHGIVGRRGVEHREALRRTRTRVAK